MNLVFIPRNKYKHKIGYHRMSFWDNNLTSKPLVKYADIMNHHRINQCKVYWLQIAAFQLSTLNTSFIENTWKLHQKNKMLRNKIWCYYFNNKTKHIILIPIYGCSKRQNTENTMSLFRFLNTYCVEKMHGQKLHWAKKNKYLAINE
jgi:hypothetical protein